MAAFPAQEEIQYDQPVITGSCGQLPATTHQEGSAPDASPVPRSPTERLRIRTDLRRA